MQQNTKNHHVDELIARFQRLAEMRKPWEKTWIDIRDYVHPSSHFMKQSTSKSKIVFDSTAEIAHENLAAGLFGLMSSPANHWFRLRHLDESLNNRKDVKAWLEQVENSLRQEFSMNGNRFYGQVFELYKDLTAFGTGIFYVEEKKLSGNIHFSCRSLGECYIAENDYGIVDTVFRKFHYTVRQAVGRWGKNVSKHIKKAWDDGELDKKLTFIHGVLPRGDISVNQSAQKTARQKPWGSYVIDLYDKTVIHESGYDTFPYQVPRWSESGGLYGFSPAMLALPDIRMVNAMAKTTLMAAQKAVDPPILAPFENGLSGIKTHPGAIIYGGLDEQGRKLYEPFNTGGNVNLGLEMEEQRRKQIREAFYHSLLEMVEKPNMTATEFMGRQEEKMRLMAPHLGRIQSEFLDLLIERVFAIKMRAGHLPPPPQALNNDERLKVDYVSPLARTGLMNEAQSMLRVMNVMKPLAEANPIILDNFDMDKVARNLAQASGISTNMIVSEEEVQRAREERLNPTFEEALTP